MTTADLETAITRTGHERYRWLVSDANADAESREGYRRIVREIAAGTWPPPDPQPAPPTAPKADFAELRNATKLGSRNCWFAEQDAGCGCNGQWCHLLKRRINIFDCVECLRKW